MSQIRAGNGALSYLQSSKPTLDLRLSTLVDELPGFADELYEMARDEAQQYLKVYVPSRIKRALVGPGKLLSVANSIFDLQCTVVFSELFDYLKDPSGASVAVDAILYQATGFECGEASEQQLLNSGSHSIRGIQKYGVARHCFNVGDPEGWLLGKELTAILQGDPLTGVIFGEEKSLATRVFAKWMVTHLIYGTLPTEEDQMNLEKLLESQKQGIEDLTIKLASLSTKQ